jgi:hypothetical protein
MQYECVIKNGNDQVLECMQVEFMVAICVKIQFELGVCTTIMDPK